MPDALGCPEDTFFDDVWTMSMDYSVWSTIVSLTCSLVYPLWRYGQGRGLMS